VDADVEALLDTGFNGDVVVPNGFITTTAPPNIEYRARLADDTPRVLGLYYGYGQVGEFDRFPIAVAMTGREFLIGRGVSDRFRIILDHGQHVIVEP
jgi:predicted aspartyl protease